MPPTRRTRNTSAPKSQNRLPFNSKVSKPSAPSSNLKDKLVSSTSKSPLSTSLVSPSEDTADSTQTQPQEGKERTAEEQNALKVSDAQIKKYWRAKEAERIAPRVHQGGLSVEEKVLREWDVGSQFGSCVGISRKKRWMRANRLGLNPPIEVLAVLVKEEERGNKTGAGRAYLDELMGSKTGLGEA